MTAFALHSGALRRITSFARDRRGVSAVEFGMVLPLMVTLYLGVVEVSTGVAIDRKVTLTTRTVADLASQAQNSINNADMTNLLNATAAVIAPYDQSKLKVTVSAVSIDDAGVAKIAWSDSLNGTPRGVGSTVTVPSALNVASSQLIWSEVQYSYTPTGGYAITGTLSLSDQIYMRPRFGDTIARVP